ncbi:ATP-dependent helicase, putative [Eimeria brunetti]|uniref:ATP-dependent helicase, putative n=1 Tax=Eimeria brunetti TaxID=51314 RepID=U6LPG4_9EIME|nr:ATP-dependent helicase, putative [Eimeria brunetti]
MGADKDTTKMERGDSTALLDESLFGGESLGGALLLLHQFLLQDSGTGTNALVLMPRKVKGKKASGLKGTQQHLQRQQQQQQKKQSSRKQRKLKQLLVCHFAPAVVRLQQLGMMKAAARAPPLPVLSVALWLVLRLRQLLLLPLLFCKKHKDRDAKAELCEELQKYQLTAIMKPVEEGTGEATAAAAPHAPDDATGSGAHQGAATAAANIDSDELQLAKTQLLLSGGLLLAGVKGRRVQKKARKALLVHQEMQRRKQQLKQQREHRAEQQKLQKEQSTYTVGREGSQQEQQHQQKQKKSVDHSSTSKQDGQPAQQSVQQQKQEEQQQAGQQQQQDQSQHCNERQASSEEQQLVNHKVKNQVKGNAAAVVAASSSNNSSSSSSRSYSTPATDAPPSEPPRSAAPGGAIRGPAAGKAPAVGVKEGKAVALPRIYFSPETATKCLHRSAAIEATRASLPAAEAEGRVLSFLLQQQHPTSREAEDCSNSSSEDEKAPANNVATQGKRKRKKVQDHSGQRHADVLCVAGSTGSGKSTQIPQFVFESGICYPHMLFHKKCQAARELLDEAIGVGPHTTKSAALEEAHAAAAAAGTRATAAAQVGFVSAELTKQGILVKKQLCICITQPRRVAALSLARRVAEELGNPELVGYQVRHDKHNVGPQCRLKFATDGVLLREIQEDFLLRKYCCIVVDEAHERNINVDLLLGLLSRVVTLRRDRFEKEKDTIPPLKVLIMSATLRATDFTANSHLFSPPPALLTLESRTFEVRIHFSKKTPDHYVQAAVRKALQIHTRLPAGSVLVFLTGRAEVLEAVKMLQEWQQRREKRLQTSAAAAFAAGGAATGERESHTEETASEADFLLSDQSDDEPLPLEQKPLASDSDREVSVHSEENAASHSSHRRWPPKPGLPDTLLELSLGSDGEDNDEPQEGVEEAEAEVLQSALSATSRVPGAPHHELGAATDKVSQGGGRGASVAAAGNNDRANPVTKRRKVTAPIQQFQQETAGGPKGTSTQAGEDPQGAEDTLDEKPTRDPATQKLTEEQAFDTPDTSKRRAQRTVSAGGWLGAGAVLRKKPSEEEKKQNSSKGDEKQPETEETEEAHFVPRLTVLPLYATLPRELQRLAFEPPAPDERRLIVATNVAETSLTLPNVRYVVDSGREKRRIFSTGSEGFSYFTVTLTTQAAAQQRAGRIPRPSAFPFPSPPPGTALANARRRLVALGALEPKPHLSKPRRKHQQDDTGEPEVCCTALGRRMSEVPIPPRFAKILLMACSRHKEHGSQFVALACYLVAALSIGELLPALPRQVDASVPAGDETPRDPGRRPWEEYDSDLDAYIWLCGAYSHAKNPTSFCKSYNLDPSRMAEVGALAAQLAQLMLALLQQVPRDHSSEGPPHDAGDDLNVLKGPLRLQPPAQEARRCLHECAVQGLIDHVAVWQDPPRLPPDATPAQRSAARGGYRCAELKGELARVHCTSNILRVSPRPKLIVYNQLIHAGRAVLQLCHPIDDADLSSSDTPLVHHSFLQLPAPAYDVRRDAVVGWSRPTYGPLQLPLPAVERPLPRIRGPVASPLSAQQQQQQQQLYACFAAALIAGRVAPRLKKFGPSLCVTPEGMVAGNHSGTFAVRAFVAELSKRDIASRAELLKLWGSEPKYLLPEFIALLRSYNYEMLQDVHDIWPPI